MHKKLLSLCLAMIMLFSLMAGLSGCSDSGETYKLAIISDGNALSDNHLNQPVWEALQEAAKKHQLEFGYYYPSSNDTATYMAGVDKLVGEGGFNVIVLPGVLFTETFTEACAKYPNCYFIGIDCNPETIPANGAAILFDKSQAGFLAGYAAALEMGEGNFGGVLGSNDAVMRELISGFMQGIEYAHTQGVGNVTAAAENFISLDSRTSYPRGQQAAATLFEQGITCLLTSSDPTGMGALAEARTRRQAGDEIWAVCSDADGHITARYSDDPDLSAALTTALCDYGFAYTSLIEELLENETSIWGRAHVFDLASGGVGLPEEPVHLSEETLEAVEEAAEAIKKGEIIITLQ